MQYLLTLQVSKYCLCRGDNVGIVNLPAYIPVYRQVCGRLIILYTLSCLLSQYRAASPIGLYLWDSVSPVRDCSVFPTTDEWPGPRSLVLNSLGRQSSARLAERAFTHLAATESNGRSVSSSWPCPMALDRVLRTVCTI